MSQKLENKTSDVKISSIQNLLTKSPCCVFFSSPAYMSSPCHIELILAEREQVVARAEDEVEVKKVSKKKMAREKMKNRE